MLAIDSTTQPTTPPNLGQDMPAIPPPPPLDGTLSDTLTYLPTSHLNKNIEPTSVDHVF